VPVPPQPRQADRQGGGGGGILRSSTVTLYFLSTSSSVSLLLLLEIVYVIEIESFRALRERKHQRCTLGWQRAISLKKNEIAERSMGSVY
jgi:hypothetical protein